MKVCDIISILRRFPENADISIQRVRSDRGFLNWDLFDLMSIEGNESDIPTENAHVVVWIEPRHTNTAR